VSRSSSRLWVLPYERASRLKVQFALAFEPSVFMATISVGSAKVPNWPQLSEWRRVGRPDTPGNIERRESCSGSTKNYDIGSDLETCRTNVQRQRSLILQHQRDQAFRNPVDRPSSINPFSLVNDIFVNYTVKGTSYLRGSIDPAGHQ